MKKQLPLPALRALNWAGFVFPAVLSALAMFSPPGNPLSRQVEDRYPNLFAPSGFTIVWGLVCLGQLLYALFQSGLLERGGDGGALVSRLGVWPALAGLLAGLWMLAWHGLRPITALLLMAALLLVLIDIHRRTDHPADARQRWFAQTPFRLYLGWASVMAICNAAAALVSVGFDGWGMPEEVWAALLVAAAAVLGLAMLLRSRDYAFAAVVNWALLGIFLRHTLQLDGRYQPVILAAVLGLIVLPGGMAYTYFEGKRWGHG